MVYFEGSRHGKWCGGRTSPTRCKYCKKRVYYFECNCGCKVFFTKLGEPWPIHDCQQDDRQLRFNFEQEENS